MPTTTCPPKESDLATPAAPCPCRCEGGKVNENAAKFWLFFFSGVLNIFGIFSAIVELAASAAGFAMSIIARAHALVVDAPVTM